MTVNKVDEIPYDDRVQIAVTFLTLVDVICIIDLICLFFLLIIFCFMADFSCLSYNLEILVILFFFDLNTIILAFINSRLLWKEAVSDLSGVIKIMKARPIPV